MLASGAESDYYVNIKEICLRGEYLRLVGELMWGMIKPSGADAVGGMTLGADPIVAAVTIAAANDGETDRRTARLSDGPLVASSENVGNGIRGALLENRGGRSSGRFSVGPVTATIEDGDEGSVIEGGDQMVISGRVSGVHRFRRDGPVDPHLGLFYHSCRLPRADRVPEDVRLVNVVANGHTKR